VVQQQEEVRGHQERVKERVKERINAIELVAFFYSSKHIQLQKQLLNTKIATHKNLLDVYNELVFIMNLFLFKEFILD